MDAFVLSHYSALMGFRRVFLAIMGLIAWSLAPAQTASETPAQLTLEQARQLAVQHNSDYRVSQAQVAAALAQLKINREYPNPTLGLNTAKISTDGTPEGTPGNNTLTDRAYDSIASLSQLLLIAKRGVMQDSAKAGVRAAELQRDDARRLLLQAVTQDYAAALAARDEAAVLIESAGKLRREADIAARRLQAGDLSRSDQEQLEIAAEQDELNAEAQRMAAKTAIVNLEILLGQPRPEGRSELTTTLEELRREAPPDLEASPVAVRPDVQAASALVDQAQANVQLQRRERIPDLTVSVQYERNPPYQTNTVGFGVSLPLPLWNHNNGAIEAAQAARVQADVQLDQRRLQANADVAAARLAYHEASERARRYRESLLPKSADAAKSVAYAYEKGGTSLVTLLDAERNDNLIRVAAVQAEADTAATGVALLSALGRLGGN